MPANGRRDLIRCLKVKQFATNKLVLNLDAKDIIKVTTKNSSHSTLRIGYREKYI